MCSPPDVNAARRSDLSGAVDLAQLPKCQDCRVTLFWGKNIRGSYSCCSLPSVVKLAAVPSQLGVSVETKHHRGREKRDRLGANESAAATAI